MNQLMNNKCCFLHIGVPKTGSTALEKFLTHNRKKLSYLGWEYPNVSLRGFGHHDFAFLLGGGYPDWATPQNRPLPELQRDLNASVFDKKRCIISSENFYLFPAPTDVAQILDKAGFPPDVVKVVVYVRRQDEAHISWYNQVIKAQGYTGSISDCINNTKQLWDYAEGLRSWAEVFGVNSVLVRPYQKGDLVKNDIRYDFLRLLDLSVKDFDFPEEKINTRINTELLEFQQILNRLPLPVQEKRRFHKDLIGLTAETEGMGLFDDTPLLTIEERRTILSQYAESNKKVACTYLGRSCLFDETMPYSRDPSVGGELNVEKLIYIFGWLLARNKES